MKGRIHIIGALFGGVCAIAFALAPLAARADVGPGKAPAPRHNVTAPTTTNTNPGAKKHMHRGNVSRKDDGCGS
ncbi:MAG TPA: hypothetical protein VHE55_03800 [Fimbriimonadaceae bacterium]|nr:hypothetical protein [Fimbriimonadaceae bacterium]